MIDLMLYYNWTYVSLVYSEGSYGENGGKKIERATRTNRICIAYSTMLSSDLTDQEIAYVIHRIRLARAKTVVLIADYEHLLQLFNHRDLVTGPPGEFICHTSDTGRDLGKSFDGAIVMGFPIKIKPGFASEVSQMTPLTNPNNPWFTEVWQSYHNCQYKNSNKRNYYKVDNISATNECEDVEHLGMPFPAFDMSPTTFDGVNAVAYSLDILIRSKCSDVVSNKKALRECVRNHDLLSVIKNITFQGVSWPVAFDQLGDLQGQYEFKQYYSTRYTKIES